MKKFSLIKIGITGATGFIGQALLNFWKDKYKICALSRKVGNNIVDKNIEWFYGDLLSEQICLEFLENIDVLIHLAQSNSPLNSVENLVDDTQINLLPTLNLFSALKKINKKIHVIYASSGGAIYGENPTNKKFNENDPCFPVSSYGIQKLTIENYLRMLSDSKTISSVVLRISNPYGILLPVQRKQGLIGVVLNKIINKQIIQVFGNPYNTRDYIHIEDLTRAFEQSLHYDNNFFETFNIGSGIGYSVEEVLKLIEQILKIKIKKEYLSIDIAQKLLAHNVLDIQKAQKMLEWTPKVHLEDGIRLMCRRYNEQ